MAETSFIPAPYNAALLLADGTTFFGYGAGWQGEAFGEICFNTSMTGYQEVLTDPSYTGQIITFTFPHIGNVGTNEEDNESTNATANGFIFHQTISEPSNYRCEQPLPEWLSGKKLTGITGIDTRALTRRIRKDGPQNVAIIYPESTKAASKEALLEKLKAWPPLEGLELARQVTTRQPYEWSESAWRHGNGYGELKDPEYHVVAIDYGEKLNILRCLAERGCRVTIVPADYPAEKILALKPDGIFLSNGPGDPAATGEYAVPIIRELLTTAVPLFGICLGHQLLALALGAQTEKMFQGHRGANHPVKRNETGQVEITSQNHGFVVCPHHVPESIEITHLSLFDGTVEGLRWKEGPAFSVQHHPESSPGPRDSMYLFDEFITLMRVQSSESGVQ